MSRCQVEVTDLELCPLYVQDEQVDGGVIQGQEEGVEGEALHEVTGIS